MSRKRIIAPAVVVLAATLGACGSSGGSSSSFSDQLQSACRTITRGLRDIDAPVSVDDFKKAADDASGVYSDGLAALKKLKAPSKQSADFKSLQSNVSDEIDLFDQISAAAKKGDQKTIATKVSSLKKLEADDADLADSLNASSCAFPSVITAAPATTTTSTTSTTTTSTTTTTTQPPTTVATTQAPTTGANTTSPGTSDSSNKTDVKLADQIKPAGDYTFVDSPDSTVTAIKFTMELDPVISAQAGTVFGVDVIANQTTITRVFGFIPDGDQLTAGSAESLQKTLAGSSPVTPATVAGVDGATFENGDKLFFVAAKGSTLVIVVATDQQSLDTGFGDFVDSVGNS